MEMNSSVAMMILMAFQETRDPAVIADDVPIVRRISRSPFFVGIARLRLHREDSFPGAVQPAVICGAAAFILAEETL